MISYRAIVAYSGNTVWSFCALSLTVKVYADRTPTIAAGAFRPAALMMIGHPSHLIWDSALPVLWAQLTPHDASSLPTRILNTNAPTGCTGASPP